jgi:hypothetical protein
MPINSTQMKQNSTGEQCRSSPWPATQSQWPEAIVKGRLTPRGGQPSAGTARPLLHVAVAYLHVEGGGAWALCQE